MNRSAEPLLRLDSLAKAYRSRREGAVQALVDFSLELDRGEIFGLLGPNGAGKTTAVRILMGFLQPSHGQVVFQGRRLAPGLPRPGLGYLPENFRPNPNLTVREYLEFQASLCGLAAGRRRETETLLSQVRMDPFGDRLIANLSKGMGQRVGLAQAMLGDPALLVLDEPTSGLDPVGKEEVIELLLHKKAQGTAVFFCSHILSEVRRLCDRIGILVAGRLRYTGTVEAFVAKWGVTELEEAFRKEAACASS